MGLWPLRYHNPGGSQFNGTRSVFCFSGKSGKSEMDRLPPSLLNGESCIARQVSERRWL
jgi:hypothetical protein